VGGQTKEFVFENTVSTGQCSDQIPGEEAERNTKERNKLEAK
jgi:hypothetical protein